MMIVMIVNGLQYYMLLQINFLNLNFLIMKRLMLLIPFLLFGMVLFAQATDPVEPGTTLEWFARFQEWFGSFPGVVVSVTFIIPVLIGVLNQNDAKAFIKYLITGLVVVLHILAASLLDLGYLHEAKLWYIILNGAGVIGAQVFGYAIFRDVLDTVAE